MGGYLAAWVDEGGAVRALDEVTAPVDSRQQTAEALVERIVAVRQR